MRKLVVVAIIVFSSFFMGRYLSIETDRKTDCIDFKDNISYTNDDEIKVEGGISISRNDYGEGRIVLSMVRGKYEENYEVPGAMIDYGRVHTGEFVLKYLDKNNECILNLNRAFKEEKLKFNMSFDLKFEDYNNDEISDFAIGQYMSSISNQYRIFTIRDNSIVEIPFESEGVISSGKGFSPIFEKDAHGNLVIDSYSRTEGKYYKKIFKWENGKFVKLKKYPVQ